jgi:hypothetical protein
MADIESQNLKSSDVKYLDRKAAAAFVKDRIGHCSPLTLARLATQGGGPAFHRCANRAIYAVPDLIEWADSKIGPKQTSTADAPNVSYKKGRFGRPPRKVAAQAESSAQ